MYSATWRKGVSSAWLLGLLLVLPRTAFEGVPELIFADSFENHDPVITSTPLTTAQVGVPYSYDVDATDVDGDTLLYLLTTAPTGMTIDPGSGLVGWTPAAIGNFPVAVDVSDGQGGAAAQGWQITVSEVPVVDSDGDGLSDAAEASYGTDPDDPDSDEDGLTDGAEVHVHGSDPLDTDSDEDGLPDGVEVNTHATDPADLDTDGDHFGDGFELDYDTDPLDPDDFPEGLPDPAALAPDNDPTVATTLLDSVEFLFNGSPPIQTGVTEGAIDPVRAAVIRGRVLTRDGDPLPDVAIKVHDRPELGMTHSRVDGRFDLVVNGGGWLTLDYEKDGYLPAQRQVDVPWQDFLQFPDMVMVGLDPKANSIELASGSAQLASGSNSNDSTGGLRAAVLLFPAGVTAELLLDGGGTQSIETLTIRATEYTVGESGPAAMPGLLPPTSGYTYAVELSADEVANTGATGLQFSQPVYSYTEDFLGFPIGSVVPAGYYDRETARWIPSSNGLVIKIIDVTDGLADLDVDGDSIADTGAALSELGITDAERQHLANRYSTGQPLWRVPLDHFTPWDFNWPFGPPLGAVRPQQEAPQAQDLVEEGQCLSDGSILECQNQVLREEVPVAGTPFLLTYRSTDVPDRKSSRRVSIPLTGDTLPPNGILKSVQLDLSIAGQTIRENFDPAPGLTTDFRWDGKDAYQREVFGKQLLRGSIGYLYDTVYYAPGDQEQAFAQWGEQPPEAVGGRNEVLFKQPFVVPLGNFDARSVGLGGWRLSVHHVYDPLGRMLITGAGNTRGGTYVGAATIQTVAGVPDSTEGDYSGDGGPALGAGIDTPVDVVALPDGGFVIADRSNDRIRRVDPNGVIATIAGNGVNSTSGDGGPATAAAVGTPDGVALGPDGSIYVSTRNRIRKIDPSGMIQTVAGTGTQGFAGDGGAATSAQLNLPRGIAVSPDGSIYIADRFNYRVRKVDPNGVIQTVAGSGSNVHGGDGGPAADAGFPQVNGLALLPDGTLCITAEYRVRCVTPDGIIRTIAGTGINGYQGDGGPAWQAQFGEVGGIAVGEDALFVADTGNELIRRIGTDGIITTVAGTTEEDAPDSFGDGGLAVGAGLYYPEAVAVDGRGRLLIAERGASHIRRVEAVLPGFSAGDISVASSDGSMLYQFDKNGRHLRTYQTLTGAVLFEFGYDGSGFLKTITDGDGKVTTVQRNDDGHPTAIVGPFGQLTTLTVDANGFLASIANPANETLEIDSSAGGLILQTMDPRGRISQYEYDEDGLLTGQTDNAGFSQTLDRNPTPTGWNVERTSGLGRTSAYLVAGIASGVQHNTNTAPDGSVSTAQFIASTAATATVSATGVSIAYLKDPDPRFGMQAPILKDLEITIPGGPTLTASSTRSAELADPADPLSLESLSDSLTIDGRTRVSEYTAANKTRVVTSPEGRATTIEYDEQGRVISYQFADLAPWSLDYNALGQLETLVVGSGPDARGSSFAYKDGFRTSFTDPLSRVSSNTRDAAGRITVQTLEDATTAQFSYNAAGDLDLITPPGQSEHVFGYTLHGQLQSATPPVVAGSGPTTFNYNADRQLLLIERPGAEQVSLTYDAQGRLQNLSLSDDGLAQTSYAYSYLPAGRLDTLTGPGAQTVSFDYQGDLVSGKSWGGVVTGGIDWAYDDSLRVTSETVTGGAGISFTYDDDSLLTAAGAFVITRDAVNGLADSAALGVVSDAWSYNSFGEITDTIVTANAVPVFDASFTRDALGRIIQKVETITGATYIYDYDYDLRGRLIEVQKDSVVIESYSYDDNGNRLSATLGGITVNGAYDTQERLLTYAGNSYAYTPAGRLLSRTEPGVLLTEYDYDIVGNLLGVTLPDATEITYELDGLDRRVQRSVNGTITQRLLYNGLRPVAELDPLGNVVSQYIYAGTHVPAYMIKAGVNYRFVADQVGSVRLVVNAATGNVAQRIDYDSFGNVLNDTNPGFQPFGFAGGIHDPLTGLVRFGARDYDPQSGRWTARDPSGFAGGLNLYQYAMSDPINYFDVTGRGLSTYIVQLVIAGVVVGVVIDIFSERGLEQIIRDIASSILGSTPVVGPAMQPLTQPDKDFYTGLIELCRGNVLMGSGGPKEYGAPPPNPDAPYIPDELLNEKPFERTHSTDTAAGRLIEDLERF